MRAAEGAYRDSGCPPGRIPWESFAMKDGRSAAAGAGTRTLMAAPAKETTQRVADRPAGQWAQRAPSLRVLLGVLPLIVMAVIAGADLLAGPGFGFLPLLSLGPALAAVSLSPGLTALVGVLGAALCLPLGAYDGLVGSRRVAVSLATIAGITAAGVVASAGRRRRERQLADVTAVAEAAQRVLLRPVPGRIGDVEAAVRYDSASAAARIGGDLYEVIAAGRVVRLIVADVQGHGLPAVQTASVVLAAFREAAYDAADLPEIAASIERSLQRQLGEEEFVTAVLAEVPPSPAPIVVLNCGHPPPLLLTGGTPQIVEPASPGPPLGLAQLLGTCYETSTVQLGPAGRILFYTDGISEARDSSGAFYPLDRCSALLDGDDLNAALDRLRGDIVRHAGRQLPDDAAMLLISRPAGAGEPGPDS